MKECEVYDTSSIYITSYTNILVVQWDLVNNMWIFSIPMVCIVWFLTKITNIRFFLSNKILNKKHILLYTTSYNKYTKCSQLTGHVYKCAIIDRSELSPYYYSSCVVAESAYANANHYTLTTNQLNDCFKILQLLGEPLCILTVRKVMKIK
jgi:hypothetical protein